MLSRIFARKVETTHSKTCSPKCCNLALSVSNTCSVPSALRAPCLDTKPKPAAATGQLPNH